MTSLRKDPEAPCQGEPSTVEDQKEDLWRLTSEHDLNEIKEQLCHAQDNIDSVKTIFLDLRLEFSSFKRSVLECLHKVLDQQTRSEADAADEEAGSLEAKSRSPKAPVRFSAEECRRIPDSFSFSTAFCPS